MAVQSATTPTGIPRKRYVKVPETNQVKDLRDAWMAAAADVDTWAMVHELLLCSTRLAMGRFRGDHWYVSVTRDHPQGIEWPNALSGWGGTPDKALRELAFRWHVLLQGTWCPTGWNLKAVPVFVERYLNTQTGEIRASAG